MAFGVTVVIKLQVIGTGEYEVVVVPNDTDFFVISSSQIFDQFKNGLSGEVSRRFTMEIGVYRCRFTTIRLI